jgi:hypothetical protein
MKYWNFIPWLEMNTWCKSNAPMETVMEIHADYIVHVLTIYNKIKPEY